METQVTYWTFKNSDKFKVPLCLLCAGQVKFIEDGVKFTTEVNLCFLNCWSFNEINGTVKNNSELISKVYDNKITLILDCTNASIDSSNEINLIERKSNNFESLFKYCDIENTKILVVQDVEYISKYCNIDSNIVNIMKDIPYYAYFTNWYNKQKIKLYPKKYSFSCFLGTTIRASRINLLSKIYQEGLESDILITKFPVKQIKNSYVNIVDKLDNNILKTQEFKNFVSTYNDEYVSKNIEKIFSYKLLDSDRNTEDKYYRQRYENQSIKNFKNKVDDQIIKKELLESCVNIVSESRFNTLYFTEKTYKCIHAKIPFIPHTTIDFNYWFKKLGFEPYLFYNHIPCNDLDAQSNFITTNIKMLNSKIETISFEDREIINHNYNNYKLLCNNMNHTISQLDK